MAKSLFTCKGCPDRYPACHDKCEKYKKEKAEWNRLRARAKEEREIQAYICKTITEKRDIAAKKSKSGPRRKTYDKL